MPSIFQRIEARWELYKLEKRYTRNRNRRSTFISNAVYVDGEYVHQVPTATGSSTNSHNSSTPSSPIDDEEMHHHHHHHPQHHSEPLDLPSSEEPSVMRRISFDVPPPSATELEEAQQHRQKKRMNRFSSMPGFGGSLSNSGSRGRDWP